jgi:hypothetical protein
MVFAAADYQPSRLRGRNAPGVAQPIKLAEALAKPTASHWRRTSSESPTRERSRRATSPGDQETADINAGQNGNQRDSPEAWSAETMLASAEGPTSSRVVERLGLDAEFMRKSCATDGSGPGRRLRKNYFDRIRRVRSTVSRGIFSDRGEQAKVPRWRQLLRAACNNGFQGLGSDCARERYSGSR